MVEFGTILPDDEYNQRLVANVHPGDWINPKPEPRYNMVVIGAGTAGLISAIAVASLGGKVAMVERHLLGGDCLNVGCIPSKSLIRPARLAAEMRDAAKWGLSSASIAKSDFPKVMERLRRIRADISKNDSVKRYTDLGVDVFLGSAVFKGPDSIEVAGQTLSFRKAVIATGARARQPDIAGLDSVDFLTNETIFSLSKLPEHLLIIGGGPIGCEMAQAFCRLGAQVTIIQKGRFLAHEDVDASQILVDSFREDGIEVLEQANVLRVDKTDFGTSRVLLEIDGEKLSVEGDKLLVSAGRVANVEDLGLELAGVAYDGHRGILVNDYLRTSNSNIYAAGDCCMAWKFTHAADVAAQIVVQNALFKGRKKCSDLIMPWCTYTDPEIAHVGMYERDADAKRIAVDFFTVEMSENDRALVDGEDRGFVKVMVKKGTDKILGATIVSAHAGEMISEITTAMVAGIGLGKLGTVIHPYPTQAEAIKRSAGLYNKSRLTPVVAKILKWWLGIQR